MSIFQGHEIHELRSGTSLVRMAPEFGGRLLSWDVDGEQVIHWPDNADWGEVARVRGGNPLLFPFVGKHFVDGKVGRWRDAAGVVRDLIHHGFARSEPFTAHPSADGAALTMRLESSATTRAGYPFDFRFEVTYRVVDPRTLDVTLTTTNLGNVPLPYYAGHHFYFAVPHGVRGAATLDLPPAQRRYLRDDGAVSAPEPDEKRYKLDDARLQDCFHCLDSGAPSQPVRLAVPGHRNAVELVLDVPGSIPWYAVTTWTEKSDSDFYCVEPWIGLPNAIHHGIGLRQVAPGAAETAAMRLRVVPLAG
jgi:galactose mutarotase-like enzyme